VSVKAAVCAFCLLPFAVTRAPQLPGRGASAPSGTGVLSGVLTSDETTPHPVRRATIRLTSTTGTSTRLAGTDDNGRFEFDALPAGSFTLSATKPGYVETFYRSRHPGRGPGVPVAVTNGQRVEVALRIVPGAVITGTITDAQGYPAPRVSVAILGLSAQGTSVPVRGVTDDRGMYRIFSLAPGDYLVSALPRLGTTPFGTSAAPSEIAGITDAEARWARGASTGTIGMAPTSPPPGPPVTYAPVFYPGTSDVAAAVKVSVGVGEERAGVDLAVEVVPTARLAGTIVDANGQATSASVSLYPRRRDQPTPADALVASGAVTMPRATVTAAGFSISGVTPGEYTLIARSGSMSRSAGPPPGTPALWCVTDLTVAGRDQTDLALRLVPGQKISGTIVFEHSTQTPPADMSAIDLSLRASGSSIGMFSASRATVAASGAFTFSSIVPWSYRFSATPPGAAAGARWTLKSAIVNGRDLADGAFEVTPGVDVAGVTITFTDHAAGIAGRIVDAAGRPISRYSIIVFPVDPAQWLPQSRRIRSAPPATDGSFTVAGLPAGEYAIAAAEDVNAADLSDPAFLAQLLASAYTVTLGEGEQRRQDLKIGGIVTTPPEDRRGDVVTLQIRED
jgi:hypothetical protein